MNIKFKACRGSKPDGIEEIPKLSGNCAEFRMEILQEGFCPDFGLETGQKFTLDKTVRI